MLHPVGDITGAYDKLRLTEHLSLPHSTVQPPNTCPCPTPPSSGNAVFSRIPNEAIMDLLTESAGTSSSPRKSRSRP